MRLIPSSAAITTTYQDFGSDAEYAKRRWLEVDGFSEVESYWEGTCLHFLTESIQPRISAPERPRVMLLFSNPHPESVKTGLLMSEKNSRGFWEILRQCKRLHINHDFRWDNTNSIRETVSLFLNGNYGDYGDSLLFFECLYPIPSKSPKDLRKLFAKADDFNRYLHYPSLERISAILTNYNIKWILIFTGGTFESIVDKPGISRNSRQILRSAVKEGNESLFWECMHKYELKKQASLPDLKHECTAIKVMDTRAKNWWLVGGRSVFSHVLDYALQYVTES